MSSKAVEYARRAFANDVPGELLDAVAEEFAESFAHSRQTGRPFETHERHEEFWRGTGELTDVIASRRERSAS